MSQMDIQVYAMNVDIPAVEYTWSSYCNGCGDKFTPGWLVAMNSVTRNQSADAQGVNSSICIFDVLRLGNKAVRLPMYCVHR